MAQHMTRIRKHTRRHAARRAREDHYSLIHKKLRWICVPTRWAGCYNQTKRLQ